MKNVTRLLLAGALLATISSCSKGSGSSGTAGYSCVCTIGYGGGVSATPYSSTTQTFSYGSISQSDAKARCSAQQSTMAQTYGTSTAANGNNGVACTLK